MVITAVTKYEVKTICTEPVILDASRCRSLNPFSIFYALRTGSLNILYNNDSLLVNIRTARQ